MKFEDLKLPEWENSNYQVVATNAARVVYDQMRAHYEAKLAEAKPEPEELFEHPDMPGKKFRRLKVGEVIQEGDWTATKGNPPGEGFLKTVCAGLFVESGDANYFYREVPQPAPEWRLPDPPPGQQWHRDDWTADMLPEGYRPLLLGEPWVKGDEIMREPPKWHVAGTWRHDFLNNGAEKDSARLRTRRPLPAPVEYVPLEPGDVPPGSAVRRVGETWWRLVEAVGSELFVIVAGRKIAWADLAAGWEILRPGSATWEPCKKPKQ